MSAVMHGRVGRGATNRYEALGGSDLPPYPDTEAARVTFEGHVERLSGWRRERGLDPVISDEEFVAMWTVYRLGRHEEWWAEKRERAVAARQAMDAGRRAEVA